MKGAVLNCETGEMEVRDLSPDEEKARTDLWESTRPHSKRERIEALLAREGLTLADFKNELDATASAKVL